MIRRGQQLIRPARTFYVYLTLLLALMCNMLPGVFGLSRTTWWPDILAMVLVYWSIHRPRHLGLFVPFFFGLLMDVHQSALLGQSALLYTVMCYVAINIHRRVLWFSLQKQSLQLLPLFAGAVLIEMSIRSLSGVFLPSLTLLLAPVIESLLWPVISHLILRGQRWHDRHH